MPKEEIMTKIILASNSPRRKKILTDLGLEFEVIPSNYEEKLETDVFSYDLIEDLATQKACDVVRRVGKDEIVLGADTVVVLHNKIFYSFSSLFNYFLPRFKKRFIIINNFTISIINYKFCFPYC